MGVPFRPCAVFCPEAAEVNSTLQFPVVQTVSGGVVPEPHTFCNLHLVGARRGIAMVVDNVASDTQVSSIVKLGGRHPRPSRFTLVRTAQSGISC